MTLSEIVMQEPFILHRSCDYCNERSVARRQLMLPKQLSENSSSSYSADPPQGCWLVQPTCSVCQSDHIAY